MMKQLQTFLSSGLLTNLLSEELQIKAERDVKLLKDVFLVFKTTTHCCIFLEILKLQMKHCS